MNNEEQIKRNTHRVEELEGRFDRHLEIYANNGKELAGVKNELIHLKNDVREGREILIQQISGMNSNVQDLKRCFQKWKEATQKLQEDNDRLQEDKAKRDDWVKWFQRLIFGAMALAILALLWK